VARDSQGCLKLQELQAPSRSFVANVTRPADVLSNAVDDPACFTSIRDRRVGQASSGPIDGKRLLDRTYRGVGLVDSLTLLSRERVGHVSDTELLHKSKGEPLRRLEVFTGSGRRRAWSAEQKARILAESYESGDEVSAVARRHGLTPQQLFGWRRDVRRRSTRRQSNAAARSRLTTSTFG
jgi:hypothetical protein